MPKVEIEKKYIILKPRPEEMSLMEEYKSSEIVQIYLPTKNGVTHRIRSRKQMDGSVSYTETKKTRIDKMSAYEDEIVIDKKTFDSLALCIDDGTRPIVKTRHTFLYCGQLFEIDFYPNYKHTCIMETELDERDKEVVFPPFIRIIANVTGNQRYTNASMSKSFPEELV